MKKFITIALLLVSITSHAQFQRYRCYKTKIIYPDASKSQKEWKDVDMLITFDLNKSKIHIYAKQELDIDMVSYTPMYKDDKGVSNLDFVGVDQTGVNARCSFMISGEVFTFIVAYTNFIIVYLTHPS